MHETDITIYNSAPNVTLHMISNRKQEKECLAINIIAGQ